MTKRNPVSTNERVMCQDNCMEHASIDSPKPLCGIHQIQMIKNTSICSFERQFWNLMSLVGDEQPGMPCDIDQQRSIEWDSDERSALSELRPSFDFR